MTGRRSSTHLPANVVRLADYQADQRVAEQRARDEETLRFIERLRSEFLARLGRSDAAPTPAS